MANDVPVNGEHKAEDTPLLSGPAYDKLKFIALILLPGVGALYVSLAGLWDFPNPEKVAATIMAVDTFLGLFLSGTSSKFKAIQAIQDSRVEGVLVTDSVNEDTGIPNVGLKITAPLADVVNADTIKLRVQNNLPPEAQPQ